jgi:hypothetical protein
MKLPIMILSLACSSALLCSAAWGQGSTSRTYTGTNGPPAGSTAPVIPDNLVFNIYGEPDVDGALDEFAFEMMSPGRCGRPYYLRGNATFQPNQPIGTIGGQMLRCTYQDLKDACLKVGIRLTDYYEVGFTGTIERYGNKYVIVITYPFTIWVKEDCTEKKETIGRETINLTYRPPGPPPRTPGDVVRDANDAADQVIIDAALLKGLREGNLR